MGGQRAAERSYFSDDSARFLLQVFQGNPADYMRLRELLAPGTHQIGNSPRERFLSWLAEYIVRQGSPVRMDGQGRYELSEANKRTILSRARSMTGTDLSSVPVRREESAQPAEMAREDYSRLREAAESGNPARVVRELAYMAREDGFGLDAQGRTEVLRALRGIRSQLRPYSRRIETLSMRRLSHLVDAAVSFPEGSHEAAEFRTHRQNARTAITRAGYWLNSAIRALENPPESWSGSRTSYEGFSRLGRFFDYLNEFDREYHGMLGIVRPARWLERLEDVRDFVVKTGISLATGLAIEGLAARFVAGSRLGRLALGGAGGVAGEEVGSLATGQESERLLAFGKGVFTSYLKLRYPEQYQRLMDWLERPR
ncbi:MAG: hypothetical protein AB1529_06960 [Candidatus Micrarchaeota archaeon]